MTLYRVTNIRALETLFFLQQVLFEHIFIYKPVTEKMAHWKLYMYNTLLDSFFAHNRSLLAAYCKLAFAGRLLPQ